MTERRFARALALLCLTLPLSTSPAAMALILDSGDGTGNTWPPPDDPGWAYVGRRTGGPTVIYLGNDWVLTADHVGAGIVTFDGEKYDPIRGTPQRLQNPDGSTADLLLFKIENGPKLPPLPISRRSPMPGEIVKMIGSGSSRGSSITLEDPKRGLRDGFHWVSDSRKRWGTNVVARRPVDITHEKGHTHSIVTIFNRIEDPTGTRQEAQAALGDSGGALFVHADPFDPEQGWLLAGVMFTVSNFPGQPKRTSFYGDATYSADLSYYRRQMIHIMRPECSTGPAYDASVLTNQALDRACLESDYPSGEPAPPETERSWLDPSRSLSSLWVLAAVFAGGLLAGIVATRVARRRPSAGQREAAEADALLRRDVGGGDAAIDQEGRSRHVR